MDKIFCLHKKENKNGIEFPNINRSPHWMGYILLFRWILCNVVDDSVWFKLDKLEPIWMHT